MCLRPAAIAELTVRVLFRSDLCFISAKFINWLNFKSVCETVKAYQPSPLSRVHITRNLPYIHTHNHTYISNSYITLIHTTMHACTHEYVTLKYIHTTHRHAFSTHTPLMHKNIHTFITCLRTCPPCWIASTLRQSLTGNSPSKVSYTSETISNHITLLTVSGLRARRAFCVE